MNSSAKVDAVGRLDEIYLPPGDSFLKYINKSQNINV
jgi:hypothetical protein